MNIGRYRVEHRLGEGPRGVVYKAYDTDGPRAHIGPVIIKVLHTHVCTDPNLERQCLDLVHAIRLLGHSSVVRPLGVGALPDGRVYLISEYVAGQTLSARLRDGGALPTLTALHGAKALAAALSAAHKQSLFHLSLKPSNVLLVSDPSVPGGERVKILDLGLGCVVPVGDGDAASLPYLAPEQLVEGEKLRVLDGQADVYTLGNVFYEMLAGQKRRSGERPSMRSIPPMPPTPIKQIFPVLFREMTALLQTMRVHDPAKRPLMSQIAHRLAQLEEDMLIGETIGAYRVLSRLAQGGMSTVFRAVNEQIGRQVAIKVMRSRFIGNAGVRERFLNEARVANLVRHPGLVEVHEFGELPRERPYLVLELLEGESLRDRRERLGGKVPEAEALDLLHKITEAVQAIHAKGVFHLDLKPDNLMILPGQKGGPERVKLLDFGTAQALEAPEQTDLVGNTDVEISMGTPGYMAPEQFGGKSAVTDRTDVYALGVMLYEALAGARPYPQVGFAPMIDPHAPLLSVAPTVSAPTAALVERMLAYRPADRPRLDEVLPALAALLRGEVPRLAIPDRPQSSAETVPMAPPEVVLRIDEEEEPPRSLVPVLPALLLVSLLCLLSFVIGRQTVRRPRPAAVAVAAPVLPAPGPEPAPAAPTVVAPEPAPPAPVLAPLRTQAKETLREGLRSREPVIRRRAAAVIGRLGQRGDGLRPSLEPLLLDTDRRVVRQAARSLGQLGEREALPALQTLLARTRDPASFIAAAEALDQLQEEEGQRRLREALQARDASVRLQAATILGRLGDASAEGLLPALLSAPNVPDVLRVSPLGRIARAGTAEARAQLVQLMDRGDAEVRTLSAQQLALLGDDLGRARLLALISKPGPERMLALWALSEASDGDCARWQRELSDPMQPALLLLSAGLAGCARPEDAPQLTSLLRAAEGEVRQAAAGALLLIK